MDYISKIFQRADIQQIRGFLVYGTECKDINVTDYAERLAETHEHLMEKVKPKFPDKNELDEINREICEYATAVQDVYMEVGLQCGAMIIAQLFENMKTKE